MNATLVNTLYKHRKQFNSEYAKSMVVSIINIKTYQSETVMGLK